VQALSSPKKFPSKNPALWSVDSPNLYTCKTRISRETRLLIENTETFGIRIVEVDSKKGFRVNGVETKLRGACIHHDNGIIGAMTFEAAEDRRVRILKQAGLMQFAAHIIPCQRRCSMLVINTGFSSWTRTFDMWYTHKTSPRLCDLVRGMLGTGCGSHGCQGL